MKNVKIKRVSLGLSQKKAAKIAGIDCSMWSYVERGKVSPTIRILDKIAKALQCKTTELLEETITV